MDYELIEEGTYIPHPQNPDIVIFESLNQYLFINGYLDDIHLVKLPQKATEEFPTDKDMTFGIACVYKTNFTGLYLWEF